MKVKIIIIYSEKLKIKCPLTRTCSAWAARRDSCTQAEAARVDDDDDDKDSSSDDETVAINASGMGAAGVMCSVATPRLMPAAQQAACNFSLAARHTLIRWQRCSQ
jgi:hypothetical protein